MTVLAGFAGSIPHAHDAFDGAPYILAGALPMLGDHGPVEVVAVSLFLAPRRHRHGFSTTPASACWACGLRPGWDGHK